MIYKDLILNKDIFSNLISFFKDGKNPNAFIFYGDSGIGKEAYAIELFAYINCKDKNNHQACGLCYSCLKVKKLQHENLEIIMPYPKSKSLNKNDHPLKALNAKQIEQLEKIYTNKGSNPYFELNFENANTILINSVREIRKNINLSLTNNNDIKVYLITQAEKLCHPSPESANALLKILEEPPSNNIFILITHDISLLLDTIVSRCIAIPFYSLEKNKIKNYLLKNHSTNEEYAKLISMICSGSIKKAVKLNKNLKYYLTIINKIINYILNDNHIIDNKLLSSLNTKDILKEILKLLNIFFNDLQKFKFSNKIEETNFFIFNNSIQKINLKHPYTNWSECIILTNNALENLNRNINLNLIIVSLFLEIKKVLNLEYINTEETKEWLNYP